MCGVIGVIGSPDSAKEAFLGLITLQHRGQDAAGILTYDKSFHLVKNVGLVENVFSREAIDSLSGNMAIGHTRYSTVGKGDAQDVQPLVLNYPYGIGVVHNGNLVNYQSVKERLQTEMRRRCFTDSDTETILNWFADKLEGNSFEHIRSAIKSVFENLQGSYSVVGLLAEGGLFAFRDPYGLRPLVLGKKLVDGKPAYMIASETIPLSFLGYELERDIRPGELVFIDRDMKMHSFVVDGTKPHRPCMFEWVYFAGAESEPEGTPVYGTRLELGRNLAKVIRERMERGEIEADIVAPVPDTSRTAATALAEELKLPYREILIKNRYIKRTFILGSQEKREKAVDLKLNPVVSELKGKNIILVDDSIVRGTTSKKIVDLVRRAGARKIYFVSTCPPIRFPCFYGIDFPDRRELIAADRTEAEIAKMLGADGVVYQDRDGLLKSLDRASHSRVKNPCTACLDGKYPTDVTESSRFAALRNSERGTG
ncbi:MAG: amidophosphoribosyltransferase [Deltaproteobacteria bacterium]|nr:amidophosphoribosyltransferase [Deltaproteobacteria bacterium]